jgi:hypothetical protein
MAALPPHLKRLLAGFSGSIEIAEETAQDWCFFCPTGKVTEADGTCAFCMKPLCAAHNPGYARPETSYNACPKCKPMLPA